MLTKLAVAVCAVSLIIIIKEIHRLLEIKKKYYRSVELEFRDWLLVHTHGRFQESFIRDIFHRNDRDLIGNLVQTFGDEFESSVKNKKEIHVRV